MGICLYGLGGSGSPRAWRQSPTCFARSHGRLGAPRTWKLWCQLPVHPCFWCIVCVSEHAHTYGCFSNFIIIFTLFTCFAYNHNKIKISLGSGEWRGCDKGLNVRWSWSSLDLSVVGDIAAKSLVGWTKWFRSFDLRFNLKYIKKRFGPRSARILPQSAYKTKP